MSIPNSVLGTVPFAPGFRKSDDVSFPLPQNQAAKPDAPASPPAKAPLVPNQPGAAVGGAVSNLLPPKNLAMAYEALPPSRIAQFDAAYRAIYQAEPGQ
jgi:hypothetical protein